MNEQKTDTQNSTQSLNDRLREMANEKPKDDETPVFENYRYGADVPPKNDIRNYLKPEVDHELFLQMFDYRWVRFDELHKNPSRKLNPVKRGEENAQWFKDDSLREADGFVGIGDLRDQKLGPELTLCIRSRFHGDEEAKQAQAYSIRRNFGVKDSSTSEAVQAQVAESNRTVQNAIPGDKSRVVDQSKRYIKAADFRPKNPVVQGALPGSSS